jgi:GNAT superfamily N-acetyltransferase
MSLKIRDALPADAPFIASLIHELAEYEKLAHQCAATPEALAQWLFAPHPKVFCLIAEWDGAPAGFALYFYNFSTFLAKPGLYLEDLFIRPDFRRKGIARNLFKALAQKAVAEGCRRLDWWVLDWNADALDFYRSLGAQSMSEWTVQRIEGDALAKLAQD